MRGFRDEAEAVRRETDAQLEDDEHRGRGDGDECGSALRAHARKARDLKV